MESSSRQFTARIVRDWTYEVSWEETAPAPSASARAGPALEGAWLVLGAGGGLGAKLARALEARGRTARVVRAPDDDASSTSGLALHGPTRADCERLLTEARVLGPIAGVVNLLTLDLAAADTLSATDMQRARETGCGALLGLAQALLEGGRGVPIWTVTRGAQPVRGCDARLALAQTPAWGFARTLGVEHPELVGGLADLDPAAHDLEREAVRLADAVLEPDEDEQWAWRGQARLVPRLVRRAPGAHVAWRADPRGSYLITGGTGAIASAVARRLAQCGARSLVLLSRRGLPPRGAWDKLPPDSGGARAVATVRALEAQGVAVQVVAADVGDEPALARLAAALAMEGRPLRGVFHGAGTGLVRPLRQTRPEDLASVFASKVEGTWALHHALRDAPLDVCVFFSSAAAVWGAREMSAYAAANAFLDGFVHWRRARGLPGLSVAWGRWENLGLAQSRAAWAADFFDRIGLLVMPAAAACEALMRLLGEGAVQATVAAVEWERFKPIYESQRRRPLLDRLGVVLSPASAAPAGSEDPQARLSLAEADALVVDALERLDFDLP